MQASGAPSRSPKIYPTTRAEALPTAVVQPGTGRVLAMSVNRAYSVADNPVGQKNRPNTVNQLIAGGGGDRGVPGRLDVQALHPAGRAGVRPAAVDRLRGADPVAHPLPGDRAGELRRTVVPGERQPVVDGRPPDHVERVRPLGEHVLRLAHRAGRRRPGGGDGRAARHRAAGRVRRQAGPLRREGLGPFTLGVAATTPLDLASAYATVAAEGTCCAPLPVVSITDSAAGRSTPPSPTADRCSTPTWRGRPPTPPAARSVTQSMYGRCDGATAPGLRRSLAPPGGGQDRQLGAVRDGDGGGVHAAARGRLDGREPGRPAGRGRSGGAGPAR